MSATAAQTLNEPTGRAPSQGPRPTRVSAWPGVALVLAGVVVMVTETPNLLFFLGLLFFVVGIYALVNRSATPSASPTA